MSSCELALDACPQVPISCGQVTRNGRAQDERKASIRLSIRRFVRKYDRLVFCLYYRRHFARCSCSTRL